MIRLFTNRLCRKHICASVCFVFAFVNVSPAYAGQITGPVSSFAAAPAAAAPVADISMAVTPTAYPSADAAAYSAHLTSGAEGTASSTSGSGGSGIVIALDPATWGAMFKRIGTKLAALGREYALLGEIIDMAIAIYNFLNEAFGGITSLLQKIAKALAAGDYFMAQMKMRLTDAIIAANNEVARSTEQVRYMQEHASAGSGHTCRALMLHQLASTTEQFEEGITDMVLSAMRYMYRGEGAAGNNARFAANVMDQRCENKFGSPVDGYPAKCVDAQTKIGPFERTLIDADISPFMLDGAVTLEVPVVEPQTETLANGTQLTYMVFKPANVEQRAFVAAFNYCINLVGPRPVPPYGKDIFTPTGMIDHDLFAQGMAVESGQDAQCAKLIGYYTRPNATQGAALRAQQNMRCLSALGTPGVDGIVSEAAIKEKFGGCTKGLSPYQSQLLGKSVCQSLSHYVELYKENALTPALLKEILSCNNAWNAWKKNHWALQGTLVDAVEGQMGVKKIWQGMSGAKTSNLANSNMSLYSYVLDEALSLSDSNIHTVNTDAKDKELYEGKAVSADEVDLPETAAP